MVRIAYFHNECAPYRMPIFAGIARLPNVSLKVYFGRYRSSDRKWDVRLNAGFDYEILREINSLPLLFSFNPEDTANPLNLSLPFKLLRDKYDVFIGGAPHYFGTIMTFLIAKMRRRPFILFLEDTDRKGGEISSYLGHFRKYVVRRAFSLPFVLTRFVFWQLVLKRSDCYVVPGSATKEYLLRRGTLASKIFVAWNAVDNDAIAKECEELTRRGKTEKLKAKLGLADKRMILSVAYLSQRKGLQYLIQACAKLKTENYSFAFVVVGDGPYKEDLMKLSVQNDVEVIFAGYVPDLITYYLTADVFVLPTLHDVWAFVINEAMVCGCPIVTTYDAGASRDLVKSGVNGYIVDAGNEEQLYQAIRNILCNPRLRREMKESSKKIVRNFSYEKSLQGYKAAIDYVLNQKKRTGRQ